ncbi:hypothetical protein HMPREF1584_00130 [Gardnerella vaginalis JCP8481A]|nr:hypothetical protein HMPREF1585_01202 [Gardnerella vaginalis JCP8481B]EPI44832.1 hypothetical protein HMPREF1584_00130 [Gardnerella vaginalis JCP8481A]
MHTMFLIVPLPGTFIYWYITFYAEYLCKVDCAEDNKRHECDT